MASFEHSLTICDRKPLLPCHIGYSGSFFSFSLRASVGICVTQQEQIWKSQALP